MGDKGRKDQNKKQKQDTAKRGRKALKAKQKQDNQSSDSLLTRSNNKPK